MNKEYVIHRIVFQEPFKNYFIVVLWQKTSGDENISSSISFDFNNFSHEDGFEQLKKK